MFSFEAFVLGNENSIFTVFYNIVHNAIKYSFIRPGNNLSDVVISVSEHPFEFHLSITNRGLRFPKEELESGNLFKFGVRGSVSSDRNRKGHGVGLWHAKKTIDEMDGKIEIESEPIDKFSQRLDTPHFNTVKLIIKKILDQ